MLKLSKDKGRCLNELSRVNRTYDTDFGEYGGIICTNHSAAVDTRGVDTSFDTQVRI